MFVQVTDLSKGLAEPVAECQTYTEAYKAMQAHCGTSLSVSPENVFSELTSYSELEDQQVYLVRPYHNRPDLSKDMIMVITIVEQERYL